MPFNHALLSEIMLMSKIERADLAKLLNVSSDYLYRLERGLKTNITLDLLERIADCTGYPPGDFIIGVGEPDKSPHEHGRPGKAPSVAELLSALDRERLARRASDYKILEIEKRSEYHMAVIEFVLAVNAILRMELTPSERAKKMAALARETAAAGIIQFDEIARIMGVTGPILRRWLELHPIRYSCRMDEERYVMAVCPDEAAIRLVCFDCESRNKNICGGFGRAYNPKDFKDFISIFETNGIIDRTDQAKLLSESFMMDYSPHEISDFISRIKRGKDIPENVMDMKVRKRKKRGK